MINYHLNRNGTDIYAETPEEVIRIMDNAIDKRHDDGGLKTPGFMTMLGSFEGYIMIYKDIKMVWTTKL